MDLGNYFKTTEGTGVLATADNDGKVNVAIYARPHVLEDGTFAFIMRDRLSHANLLSNPHAAYMFIEKGNGHVGKRLFLTKVREEKDSELLFKLRKRTYPDKGPVKDDPMFLVCFTVDKVLPLVGNGEG